MSAAPDKGSPVARSGLLPWVFPAMLLVAAVDVLLSGRDLATSFQALQVVSAPGRPAVVDWLQRGVSLLLLVASVEQVANHVALRQPVPSLPLLGAFVAYWVGSIGLPAVLGAYPQVSHDLLYAPAVGVACCLATPEERHRLLGVARDTLMALMLAGLVVAVARPRLAMDMAYTAGLLPGLPRFAGLTSHPVTQGLLAQVALLLLQARPYGRRGLQRAAWVLGLAVLVMAQSKSAWVAFLVASLAMALVRHGPGWWRRVGDPSQAGAGLLAGGTLALGVVLLAAATLSGAFAEQLASFAASEQGAQLLTLTGRDRIWAAAQEEWRSHPVFGYGLSLWDASYRAAIGLPQATHAHNQLLDDAARAGTVGVGALLAYAAVLTAASLRHARATAGLSLALFITLALRAVGEVPLSLIGYGSELFTHLLLVATLAAAAAGTAIPARAVPSAHPVQSRRTP